jgi:hypothetical protein
MSRIIDPFFSVIDINDDAIPGAKLYFFDTGTNNPKDTYSDVLLTVPNTNPVISSASGRFGPVFTADGESYKVVLTDANDVLIVEADPVESEVDATSLAQTITDANAAAAAAASSSADAATSATDASNAAAIAVAEIETAASSVNEIINGQFDIWENGVTFSTIGYNADMFESEASGSSSTETQQSFISGQSDVPEFPEFYHRSTVDSAGAGAADYLFQAAKIEDVRKFSGQNATFSFWAKSNNSQAVAIEMSQIFGSGGSSQVNALPQTISLTTAWVKHEITFSVPSVSGKTIGAGSHISINVWQSAGSSFSSRSGGIGIAAVGDQMETANWKLQKGSIATDFIKEDKGITLQKCRRYFQNLGNISFNNYFDSANITETIILTSCMMSAPSITTGGTSNLINLNTFSFDNVTSSSLQALYSGSVTGQVRVRQDSVKLDSRL